MADLAGVKHDNMFRVTSVDAPETMRYVKGQDDIIWERPQYTMVQLIVKHRIPPTRLMRYCCSEFKEKGGKGRVKVTGTRWAESKSRKENQGFVTAIDGYKKKNKKVLDELNVEYKETPKGGVILNNDNSESRKFVEFCYKNSHTLINPIVDWTNDDVWDFLHYYGCESNPLYQCGFKRIGCVGCPLGGFASQRRELDYWPGYRKMYLYAFDKMLKEWDKIGKPREEFVDAECVMSWWTGITWHNNDDPRRRRTGKNSKQITTDDNHEKEKDEEEKS